MSGVTIQGPRVIVVGGGLAGLSAAHTVLERGGRVLVLDKLEFLGGNSVKATSGINGAGTRVQYEKKIYDSSLAFERDTAIGGNGGKEMPATPLMKVLTHNSGSAVEWLIERFNLDLSLISRLGGHSFPRTHRGKERFPGMTITYALMEKFEELATRMPDKAQVVTLARATKLLTNDRGDVIGVEFEKKGQKFQEYGPVIIATGGYGADFGPNSILAKYRPDLLHLPTTNGDHCTGDGLQMTMGIGGAAVDLKWVQVHPTGMVHPNEPDAKLKFLAAEALRGVGGIILDKDGNRFVNELGTRDYVTGQMWKRNKAPYRLVLNGKASKEIEWHCKHYVGRGLMKRYEGVQQFAADAGISEDALKATFEDHNEAERTNKDKYGKLYFHNGPWNNSDVFHVAIITPVIHYCMGGVKIDTDSHIVREENNAPIGGLFAAGEVAGGVHGINRLGGSGLLGCVVFGRVAGAAASKELLAALSADPSGGKAARRLGAVGGQFINIEIAPSGKGIHIDVNLDGANAGAVASAPAPAAAAAAAPAAAPAAGGAPAAPAPAAAPALKEYTLDEVAKHNTDKDCWVVVNGEVLNVTDFLPRHPGGKAAIMLFAGKDATAEFNMLHKPDVVAKYAPDSIIGKLKK